MKKSYVLILLTMMWLATAYLGEGNYYVKKQMTELALAGVLGIYVTTLY